MPCEIITYVPIVPKLAAQSSEMTSLVSHQPGQKGPKAEPLLGIYAGHLIQLVPLWPAWLRFGHQGTAKKQGCGVGCHGRPAESLAEPPWAFSPGGCVGPVFSAHISRGRGQMSCWRGCVDPARLPAEKD